MFKLKNSDLIKKLALGFTVRGWLVLVGALYLVFVPYRLEADLVAGTIGGAVLILVLVVWGLTLTLGFATKRRLTVSIHPPSEKIYAKSKCLFVYTVSPVSVLPLWALKLKVAFSRGEIETGQIPIVGIKRKERVLSEELTFPHRGIWAISTVNAALSDQLGLTSFTWQAPIKNNSLEIYVKPAETFPVSIPVISSTHRPGESAISDAKRSGDPFDLKPYHPSDGIRKILWKIYAKSGELISRHQERAMTPEGTAIVFALANHKDDYICSSALNYLRKLEELNLEIYFSCEGASKDSTELGSAIARSADMAETLLIETVWNTFNTDEALLKRDLELLVNGVQESSNTTKIDKIMVFASPSRLRDQNQFKLLGAVGSYLGSLGISPVFCLKDGVTSRESFNNAASGSSSLFHELKESFKSYLFELPAKDSPPQNLLPQFLTACSKNNWQVVV